MKDFCSVCGKEFDSSELYESRGIIYCASCEKEAVAKRDYERQEIIEESKHKTDRFKGLDLSDSQIGKANRAILKQDIEIARKERGRREDYEGYGKEIRD